MKYLLIAGEASGDEHGARLIASLKAVDAKAAFSFIGGDKMAQQAGVAPLYHYREIAVMGFTSVLRSMRKIRLAARLLQEEMRSNPPDVVIPIDYGGFNLRYTLPMAHRHGVPVVYYIPPKVWASRRRRIKRLQSYADLCLTILPFEADYLSQRGVTARYVGNPSIQSVGKLLDSNAKLCDTARPYIALLPGSREAEITRNLPIMCQAIDLLPAPWRAVIAGAPSIDPAHYTPYLSERIELVTDETLPLLAGASAALVTSGTATLETALIGTPQVVAYRLPVGRLARWAFDHLLPIRYFSLVNLIAESPVVEELLGDAVTAQRLVQALNPLLDRESTAYQTQQAQYRMVRQRLEPSRIASQVAAERIYHELSTQWESEE
ncbi:lipid-A-disaccharide synthase [Porphyromonas asaccharolytica PR426713P-I]|uniref:lipid-A-disaccharide synthase n=1 Tax=Porphyromonas asaccharolytica TaxID=28123 RepID=UPI0001EB1B75|nr:lipid-A-disaccharide synthase [Porphyromonas asaccharolytica]EFR35288.1 lipid-A-disaccharide synthase [Porphyromonas asaccharolytica PR426713P-I]